MAEVGIMKTEFEAQTIRMLVELKEDVAVIKQKMRTGESFIGKIITVMCAVVASVIASRIKM
jgi:hypothetical protein